MSCFGLQSQQIRCFFVGLICFVSFSHTENILDFCSQMKLLFANFQFLTLSLIQPLCVSVCVSMFPLFNNVFKYLQLEEIFEGEREKKAYSKKTKERRETSDGGSLTPLLKH